MTIKMNLSLLLGKHKLRAAELARKTKINKNTLSSLYQESSKGIRFDTLDKLCSFFRCSVGDVLEHVPKKQPAPKT